MVLSFSFCWLELDLTIFCQPMMWETLIWSEGMLFRLLVWKGLDLKTRQDWFRSAQIESLVWRSCLVRNKGIVAKEATPLFLMVLASREVTTGKQPVRVKSQKGFDMLRPRFGPRPSPTAAVMDDAFVRDWALRRCGRRRIHMDAHGYCNIYGMIYGYPEIYRYIYMGSFTISGELLSAPQAASRKDFCCFTWRSLSFVTTCFNIDKLGPKGKAFLSFFCVGCGTATLSLVASSASWFEGYFVLAAGMANPYWGQQDARHATSELRQFQLRWQLLFDAKSYFIAVIFRVRYSWTRLIVGCWLSISVNLFCNPS